MPSRRSILSLTLALGCADATGNGDSTSSAAGDDGAATTAAPATSVGAETSDGAPTTAGDTTAGVPGSTTADASSGAAETAGTDDGGDPTSIDICGYTDLAVAYTTDFPATEDPISEGGAWVHVGLDWAVVQTMPGHAAGTQTGSDGYDDSYAHLTGFPPDQGAVAVLDLIGDTSDGQIREAEILLRWSDGPHDAHGYEININFQGAYAEIVRWNGPYGDFTYLTQIGDPPVPQTGDVYAAAIVGDQIVVCYNGEMLMSAQDGTWTDGNPGMGFFIREGADPTDFGFSRFTAAAIP